MVYNLHIWETSVTVFHCIFGVLLYAGNVQSVTNLCDKTSVRRALSQNVDLCYHLILRLNSQKLFFQNEL